MVRYCYDIAVGDAGLFLGRGTPQQNSIILCTDSSSHLFLVSHQLSTLSIPSNSVFYLKIAGNHSQCYLHPTTKNSSFFVSQAYSSQPQQQPANTHWSAKSVQTGKTIFYRPPSARNQPAQTGGKIVCSISLRPRHISIFSISFPSGLWVVKFRCSTVD